MVSLRELIHFFLKIGSLGFGGPLALVALMQQECVDRKKWIDPKRFEETFVFCKMLPGPIAYQMALWVGYEIRGRWGGLLAGIAFVLPAALLLYAFAKSHEIFSSVGAAAPLLEGMRAASLAIILQSVIALYSPYRKSRPALLYALLGACLMLLFPRWEPLIILSGGALSVILQESLQDFRLKLSSPGLLLALFWTHFKAGAFVFGTGLAIVPVLQKEAVDAFGWLSREEFLDALAFGQVTPGPVTTLAAFIGFKAAGEWGSLVATLGMYLPGALMILWILPALRKKIESRSWLIAFQAGAVPTVIGCLAVAALQLLLSTLKTPVLAAVFGIVLISQLKWKLAPWALILLGGGLQFLLKFYVS